MECFYPRSLCIFRSALLTRTREKTRMLVKLGLCPGKNNGNCELQSCLVCVCVCVCVCVHGLPDLIGTCRLPIGTQPALAGCLGLVTQPTSESRHPGAHSPPRSL